MRFSAVTETALLKAGWYEGRAVEESTVKNWYALKWPFGGGYIYAFSAALKFLREFGGLKIFRRHTETWIDPLTALREMDAPTWAYNEWLLDDRLFPIGVGNAAWTLSIGLRGRIYAFSQNSGGFYSLGETPEQGIESMVLGFDVNKPLILAEEDNDAEAIADAVERLCKFESK